jgi:hypothetical protein
MRSDAHSIVMFTKDRDDPRERIALPLKIGDGLMAVTRDIGPSGMYVEIKGKHELTGKLVFELQLPGLKFTAEGEILRIDHLPGSTGLAIKFHESRLESIIGTFAHCQSVELTGHVARTASRSGDIAPP